MPQLFEQMVDTLSPDLGKSSATASVRLFVGKAKLTPDELRSEHLSRIAELMKPGLRVFVGASRADELARAICALDDAQGVAK